MSDIYRKFNQIACPPCDFGPFTRNYYFTGKLLVERDFRDETAYHSEKLRHHEHRLHGAGVVCGLRVKQHDNPACQSRYVYVEPGFAIDCCGHDVVVREQALVDLNADPAIQALQQAGDTNTHTLQVCVSFRECPTEAIPVLYDDCGCDEAQCAPNRILESYDVNILVDPKPTARGFSAPAMHWGNSIARGPGFRVAYHAPTQRLYVMTADSPALLFQIETLHHTIVTFTTLTAKGVGLAVSPTGDRIYAFTEATSGSASDPRELHVLDATQNLLPQVQSLPLPAAETAASGTAYVDVTSSGSVLAMLSVPGDIVSWDTTINTKPPPAANPAKTISGLGANLAGIDLSSDGKTAYVGDPAGQIDTFDPVAVAAGAPITGVLPAGSKPTALAVVRSAGQDTLAVADATGPCLRLVGVNPAALIGSATLQYAPIGLAVSPDGRWGYVLEQSGSASYVESIDIERIQQGRPQQSGAAFPVGANSQQIVITSDGRHLYVPYTGDSTSNTDGEVAIVDVTEQKCGDILWRSLEECPDCPTADCVVLATIKNYKLGDAILNQTHPASDPAQDLTNAIARIDNREGRVLLPSTRAITEVVECLLEQGPGATGPQGPPGPPGQPGSTGTPGTDGLGLNANLPKILDVGWVHAPNAPGSSVAWKDFAASLHVGNLSTSVASYTAAEVHKALQGVMAANNNTPPMLTIYFNQHMVGIDRQTFCVSIEYPTVVSKTKSPTDDVCTGLYNQERVRIYGFVFDLGQGFTTPHTGDTNSWAWTFIPAPQFFGRLAGQGFGVLERSGAWGGQNVQPRLDLPTVNILLKGDFVWSDQGNGSPFNDAWVLDADNIGGQVGVKPRSRLSTLLGGTNPSGNFAEGGDFESWFFLGSPLVIGGQLAPADEVGNEPQPQAAPTPARTTRPRVGNS